MSKMAEFSKTHDFDFEQPLMADDFVNSAEYFNRFGISPTVFTTVEGSVHHGLVGSRDFPGEPDECEFVVIAKNEDIRELLKIEVQDMIASMLFGMASEL